MVLGGRKRRFVIGNPLNDTTKRSPRCPCFRAELHGGVQEGTPNILPGHADIIPWAAAKERKVKWR